MPNYQEAKIYLITSNDCDKAYLGSTTMSLRERLRSHKSAPNGTGHKTPCTSKLVMIGEYGIYLLEAYPCSNKKELSIREQYWMDELKGQLVNKLRATPAPESVIKARMSKTDKKHKTRKRAWMKSMGGHYSNNGIVINSLAGIQPDLFS